MLDPDTCIVLPFGALDNGRRRSGYRIMSSRDFSSKHVILQRWEDGGNWCIIGHMMPGISSVLPSSEARPDQYHDGVGYQFDLSDADHAWLRMRCE